MSSTIHEDFVSSAPPAPDKEALTAVRAMAKERARRSHGSVGFRSLRTTGSLVLVAAVVAAVAFGVAVRGNDPAFASPRAIAALAPQDGVLHTIWELATAPRGVPEQIIEGEDWLDVGARRARSSMGSADGEDLNGTVLTVSQGDQVRGLDHDVAKDEYRITEYNFPFEGNSRFGGYTELLVEGLQAGDARAVGQVTIDGERYWTVEMETGSERISAILGLEDYRLKDITLHRPHDGEWIQEVHFSFSVWETVPRESLASDFFELTQIDKEAPAGTRVYVESEMNQ